MAWDSVILSSFRLYDKEDMAHLNKFHIKMTSNWLSKLVFEVQEQQRCQAILGVEAMFVNLGRDQMIVTVVFHSSQSWGWSASGEGKVSS